ncbi:MAG: alpha/beta fold hydrolase, partial [Candidatus Binatia bacterium]
MAKILISKARPARRRDAAKASADYGASAEPDWRTVDWRSRQHDAEIMGAKVHYVDLGESGDEAPVVFVHGLGGSWQNWLENVPAVARTRRAIAVDLPGFGWSEPPAGNISISGFADAVEALCDHLDLGPVALVGNSMGGFTSAEAAIRHPDRVERLVLVDAAGISTSELMRRPARAMAKMLTLGTTARARRTEPAGSRAVLPARPGALHAAVATIARHPTRLKRDLL